MSVKRYGPRNGVLGAVLQTLPGKLASHWLIQSMAYMDRTERTFKLALDAVLALVLAPVLVIVGMPSVLAAGVALVLAHSLNFLFNGHLRGALKWHGIGGVPRASLETELVEIARRLTGNPAIKDAFVYGSLSRGELHDGSDLDIRVVREPGFGAGLGACIAVLLERTRSLASGVPLDIYVWDSTARLERMRSDEPPVDLRAIASGRSDAATGPKRGLAAEPPGLLASMQRRARRSAGPRVGVVLMILAAIALLVAFGTRRASLASAVPRLRRQHRRSPDGRQRRDP